MRRARGGAPAAEAGLPRIGRTGRGRQHALAGIPAFHHALRNANPSITALTNTASKAQDIERYGLRLELEQIQARYEDGDLCRSSYKRLRENVALMQVDLEDNV